MSVSSTAVHKLGRSTKYFVTLCLVLSVKCNISKPTDNKFQHTVNDFAGLQQWLCYLQGTEFESHLRPGELSPVIRFLHTPNQTQMPSSVVQYEKHAFCHDIALPQ